MSKHKCLGTSPDYDNCVKLISEYFYGANIRLQEIEPGLYDVLNSNGLLYRHRVIVKKNRWRFEVLD